MRSTSKIATLSSSLVLLVVSTASASETCSNAILHGRYAHLVEGVFGPGITPFAQTYANGTPFRGIQMLEFDGKGGITGSESLMAGGGEVTKLDDKRFSPLVGSYSVSPDCTGVAYLCANHGIGSVSGDGPSTCNADTITAPGFLWNSFVQTNVVIAERGKKFHMLVVPPFDGDKTVRTITSTGTKLSDDIRGEHEHRDDR
jgi:hypothetical protein